jgi:6-pyruvoyltetrahydropterin/6-carboxytetrahydropterin synthase
MFTISKSFTFEAAHKLPHHNGKCARLHGHSWRATVFLRGETLCKGGPSDSMLIDFGDISKAITELKDKWLDHYYLNESLRLENPTSEEVAKFIYKFLKPIFRQMLYAVKVEETCTSAATYEP